MKRIDQTAKAEENQEGIGEFTRIVNRCPECGGEDLSLVIRGMKQFGVVLRSAEQGKAEYLGDQVDFDEALIRCECTDCGYLLRDDWGSTFVDECQLLKWVMDNCQQAGSKGPSLGSTAE